jgi:hypothetical protein
MKPRVRASLGAGAIAAYLIATGCSSSPVNSPAEPAISVDDAATRQEALRTDMRKLWEDHVTWTRQFIVSALAGAPDTDASAQRLLQNQTDIGNAIKPLYGDAAGAQLTSLLRDHTLAEAVDQLKGDWAGSIAEYDRIHVQILKMADMLTAGIVAQFPNQFGEPVDPSATAALRADMRKLWEDHVTWTRMFIVSAEARAADTDATAQRLLQNQADIGNAIKPLYGDAAGAQLTSLLRDHILTAGELIGAAMAGDTAKVTTTKDRWYANADDISGFLAKANPDHWPLTTMAPMMREHLDHTLSEAVNHLKGDWTADIAEYDHIHAQILEMADMLTDGIVGQFPAKFS